MQRWIRARNVGLTILIWIALVFIIAWTIGHFITAVIIFVIGALLAYALSPGVALLRRARVPRPLAIVIVYLVAVCVFGGLLFYIVSTAITQLGTFAQNLPSLLRPSAPGQPQPTILRLLQPLGVTPAQYNAARNALISQVESSATSIASSAIPVITAIATGIVDFILIFILSIYLVIDGPKAINWLRTATPRPQRGLVLLFLSILTSKVGGYIRGQIIMSTFIGVLVGGGMAAFQVPFALLLGVIAFLMEFVPILGVIISGAACVMVTLATKGFLLAVGVLGYFVIVHILEGDVVGPRVVGRAVGLHPVVAILALAIGTELFGIWGAVFSAPVAGVVQAIILSLWTEWHKLHPEQFPPAPPKDEPPKSEPPQDKEEQEQQPPTLPTSRLPC